MKWKVLLLGMFYIVFSTAAVAAEGLSKNHPIASFTLKTVMQGEQRLFVGVGGKIDGLVNPNLSVRQWDVVKIILVNRDGLSHHIAVPDFFIVSEEVTEKGSKTAITFVPFKNGGFSCFCLLDNHRELGMKGLLTISRR